MQGNESGRESAQTMSSEATRRIADLTVTRISEASFKVPLVTLIPELGERGGEELLFPPGFLGPDQELELAIHAWLVRGPEWTLLVDTGTGAKKNRPSSPAFHRRESDFLDQLAAAGVKPEQVDYVLHTHLHVDHVGWNTRLADNGAWIPTFAKARHIFSEDEYRFFANPANMIARHNNSFLARNDSVDPLVANDQAVFVPAEGGEPVPGITFVPTPGHSPFHFSISIEQGGQRLLFSGDVFHHPAQVLVPSANSAFDADPARAAASRHRFLELASESDTTTFCTHVGGSSVLRIERAESAFSWTEL